MEYGHIWTTSADAYTYLNIHTKGQTKLEGGELVMSKTGFYEFISNTSAPTSATLFIDGVARLTSGDKRTDVRFGLHIEEGQHVRIMWDDFVPSSRVELPPIITQFRLVLETPILEG